MTSLAGGNGSAGGTGTEGGGGDPDSEKGTEGGMGGGTGGGGGFTSGVLLEVPCNGCRKLPLFPVAGGWGFNFLVLWRRFSEWSLVLTPCPTRTSERLSVIAIKWTCAKMHLKSL